MSQSANKPLLPITPLTFWFEFSGMFIILFGAIVDWIENELGRFPAFLGYGFMFLNILAIVTMPIGGGWLLVPGAIGLFLKSSKTATNVGV